jgi:hypothetical protein
MDEQTTKVCAHASGFGEQLRQLQAADVEHEVRLQDTEGELRGALASLEKRGDARDADIARLRHEVLLLGRAFDNHGDRIGTIEQQGNVDEARLRGLEARASDLERNQRVTHGGAVTPLSEQLGDTNGRVLALMERVEHLEGMHDLRTPLLDRLAKIERLLGLAS